jgi:integrase/recombinase XerC
MCMNLTVSAIFSKYLDWCQKHRSARTHQWYAGHIRGFLAHLGESADIPACELKPYHVVEWVDEQAKWGDTYKRGAISAVQRVFNWAEELGYIEASTIKRIRKPSAGRRDNPLPLADYERMLALLPPRDPFRDVLVFAWNTGCRPQELRHIEPRHVDLAERCIVIPKEEAKGKRRARVILLHGPALEVVIRLMAKRCDGKLFRNTRGSAWNRHSLCNRMERLSKQIGKRYALYDLRHSFCQRLLEAGVGHIALAEIMGHVNAQMVSAVYSHMNRATSHLREALAKGLG